MFGYEKPLAVLVACYHEKGVLGSFVGERCGEGEGFQSPFVEIAVD